MEGVEKTISAQTEKQVKKRVANVVLLGCGGVGGYLLQRILATRALHASTGLHVAVVAVSDSKGMVLSKEELDDSALKDIISTKAKNVSLSQWYSSARLRQAADVSQRTVINESWNETVLSHCLDLEQRFDSLWMTSSNPVAIQQRSTFMSEILNFPCILIDDTEKCVTARTPVLADNEALLQYRPTAGNESTLQVLQTWNKTTVVVDCTATEETGELLGQAAVQGFCVVLANKKPITATLDVYDRITSAGRCFRCESTVGAGLPVMAALSRTLAAGDPIHRIVGALSGTLGYVMSGLQDGRPYSEVVVTAKALGYTEPDPRDDLSGMDVARKALIMARAIGWRLNMEDVEVMSLYPPEMGPLNMPVEEFLARLPSIDLWMCGKVLAAQERRSVLRYVATIENNKCKVSFMEVSSASPLGRLRGSDNLVEIYTDCYKMAPLVIQGAGAGNETTAAGVLADIIDLQDLYKSGN